MAVENRYVVVRADKGEVATFMDKKEADAYDRMLDMAEAMQSLLGQAELNLSEDDAESLAVYLAEHRDDVLLALQAKRPSTKSTAKSKAAPKSVKSAAKAQPTDDAA